MEIGREGIACETHDEYLNDFINHFYKNVLKLVDRAMRKEDTSPQGKIITGQLIFALLEERKQLSTKNLLNWQIFWKFLQCQSLPVTASHCQSLPVTASSCKSLWVPVIDCKFMQTHPCFPSKRKSNEMLQRFFSIYMHVIQILKYFMAVKLNSRF